MKEEGSIRYKGKRKGIENQERCKRKKGEIKKQGRREIILKRKKLHEWKLGTWEGMVREGGEEKHRRQREIYIKKIKGTQRS